MPIYSKVCVMAAAGAFPAGSIAYKATRGRGSLTRRPALPPGVQARAFVSDEIAHTFSNLQGDFVRAGEGAGAKLRAFA
jgi:hypothetical protein